MPPVISDIASHTMLKAAYVGILDPGTTSRMRAECLRELTPGWDWRWVDTAAPFHVSPRWARSAAFRLKAGPAVNAINRAVTTGIGTGAYDLIWVDKAVYLWPDTVRKLRSAAAHLVHFTPDCAFFANKSRHFERSLPLFDLAVTTKSFCMEDYGCRLPEGKVHLTTQGYDRHLHVQENTVRRKEAVFIGLCEPDRERCIGLLLDACIPVRLGGCGWQRFLRRWNRCPHLFFEGEAIFGKSYAKLLSASWVGLGLMSKRFPELHTTRTFEIPACGAILATESNPEIRTFFAHDEALFIESYSSLGGQLKGLFSDEGRMERIASAGRRRVERDGRDYHSILAAVLRKLLPGVDFPPTDVEAAIVSAPADIRSRASSGVSPGDPAGHQPRVPSGATPDPAAAGPLCIGFLGADWWGSDARAMAAEFRRRGHLLVERNYEDWLPTRWRGWWLKVARRFLHPGIVRGYNTGVSELLSIESLDFLLVFKGMLLQPETLDRFKRAGLPCYCFYPDVSFEDHGRNILQSLPYYDCVVTTKSYHLKEVKLFNKVKRLEFARHGFDPEVHRTVVVSESLESSYGCDVSFVGVWSPKKDRLLSALLSGCPGVDLQIWGPAWDRASPDVRNAWKGRGAYGDEVAAIYACSRINLGLLSEAGGGGAGGDRTTARTWQIPASKGFMLHEDTVEVRRYFESGKEVGLFMDDTDLAAKVRHYLAAPEERLAVRDAGWRRALSAPYSYAPAVDRILEVHAEMLKS